MVIDWGDIGPLSIEEGSLIKDKVGAIIMPGSTEVLDTATGELVACDASTCPHAVDGVNFRAVCGVWRLDRRSLCDTGRPKEAGRLRLPELYEPGRAVECRRDHGLDRLQPVPELPVEIQRVGRGRL